MLYTAKHSVAAEWVGHHNATASEPKKYFIILHTIHMMGTMTTQCATKK